MANATAALGGNPNIVTDDHPAVRAALAARDVAQRNLDKTTVLAPAAGIVSQVGSLNVGQFINTGSTIATLVETGDMWVEANFKETQLVGLKAGMPAEVTVDAFPGVKFEGQVASIGAATGAEFALIPAQNATGNWVKVTQRIPVTVVGRGRRPAAAARRHERRRQRRHQACGQRAGRAEGELTWPPQPPSPQPTVVVKNKGLLTLAIMVAVIMQVLDTTIANVALPHMRASLGASQDEINWVLTSYIVAAAIATPLTGWFSDRLGRHNLMLIAVVGFTGASLLCGIATSLPQMVLFRVHAGHVRRRAGAAGAGDDDGHQPARATRAGDGDLRRRHHVRADHRADAGRLAHRDLQLARRVPRQPADRHHRLPDAVHADAPQRHQDPQVRLLRLRHAGHHGRFAADAARSRPGRRLVRFAGNLGLPAPRHLWPVGVRGALPDGRESRSSTSACSRTATSSPASR